MYLHFDTETDGLPVSGQPSDAPGQPHYLSISAVLDDAEGNILHTYSTLIKPAAPVPAFITKINGLTFERLEADGTPLQQAMEEFRAMAARADIMVAFNHFFDHKIMKINCARIPNGEDVRELLETKSAICTMEAAAWNIKKGKFIKLQVAHQTLLGEGFDKAHELMADTEASRRIFYHLKSIDSLPEPKPLTRKVYDTPPPTREHATPETHRGHRDTKLRPGTTQADLDNGSAEIPAVPRRKPTSLA